MDLKQSETGKRLQAGKNAGGHKPNRRFNPTPFLDSKPSVLSHFLSQQTNKKS